METFEYEDPSAKITKVTFLAQWCLTVILVLFDLLNLLYKFGSKKRHQVPIQKFPKWKLIYSSKFVLF
jgi:hypothetical protein